MTYLIVSPNDPQTVVITETALGSRYVLRKEDAVNLAAAILLAAASPGRVPANLGASATPQPSQFPQPQFTPGPATVSPAMAELERARNQPYTPPTTPPTTPGTGGMTTLGGDRKP